jgi:hypothetical protein
MKKLVLIFTLLFAMSMQANTINNNQKKQDVNQINTATSLEIPNNIRRMVCHTTSTTTYHKNDDGSIDIVTVSITHCEEAQ